MAKTRTKKKKTTRFQVKLNVPAIIVATGVIALATFGFADYLKHRTDKQLLTNRLDSNMEQIARETQYDFGEFIRANISKDDAISLSNGFARTCTVWGEDYPGDKHQLVCRALNTTDGYPEYFPSPGLDATSGAAIVQQAKAVGEKLQYAMELSTDSDGVVTDTTGKRGECEITFGYQLASAPYAYGSAPKWTESTPSLTYKLECRHTIFRNREGSMTTPCNKYEDILPNGYVCG